MERRANIDEALERTARRAAESLDGALQLVADNTTLGERDIRRIVQNAAEPARYVASAAFTLGLFDEAAMIHEGIGALYDRAGLPNSFAHHAQEIREHAAARMRLPPDEEERSRRR